MKELEALEKYFCNIVLAIKKPTVVIPTLGLSLTLKNDYIMIFLLLILFAVDFVTGVLASYVEFKKSDKKGKFFSDKEDGFTSARWRLTFVKAITYFLLIILTKVIEDVFKIKAFNWSWTDHKVTISLISIAFSCAIEFYSIFWENLPKAGFSIWGYFKKITGTAKEAVSEIKSIKDGNSTT